MKKRYKIGMVDYTNTLPYVRAIEESQDSNFAFEIISLKPFDCARYFKESKVDIAIVPAATLLELSDFKYIPSHGIACDGPVRTVKILSNCPIEKATKIILDSDSRTSVHLADYLLKHHWKLDLERGVGDVTDDYGHQTAILAIGDKVIDLENDYEYQYDLGEIWKNLTGCSFVFAVWISRSNVPQVVDNHLSHIFIEYAKNMIKLKDEVVLIKPWVNQYFTSNIKYQLSKEDFSIMKDFLLWIKTPAKELDFKISNAVSNVV